MNKLRCIIVGYGLISRQMIPFLRAEPWFELVGVVEPNPVGRDSAAAEGKVSSDRLHADLNAALARCDADVAIINTPGEMHAAQAKQCLEAGLHVLVAKPIATAWRDAVELVELARAKKRTISVAQQIRYMRHYRAVQRFIANDGIGKPEAVFFQNSKPRPKALNLGKSSQPALYEMACHHFDSLLSVFPGRRPAWISCDGFRPSWSPYQGPCMINALIRFDDGLRILYHGGFSSQTSMYDFRIEGNAGALRCRGVHMSSDEMSYEVAPALGAFAKQEIDDGIAGGMPWPHFFSLWSAYVFGGEEPPFSGANNLMVMAMIAAAEESLRDGTPKEISPDAKYSPAFPRRIEASAS